MSFERRLGGFAGHDVVRERLSQNPSFLRDAAFIEMGIDGRVNVIP